MDRPLKRLAIACRLIDGVTGTTTGIVERTRRFTERGWEVHLFGERLDKKRIRSVGGVPHVTLNLPLGGYLKRKLFSGFFNRDTFRSSFDLLEGHGDTLHQDALMLHNCVHAAHEAIQGTPIRSHLGDLHARILRERRFRLLIANSQMMKNEVARRFDVPTEIIHVVYPGHDPKRFRVEDRLKLGEPLRRELGIGKGMVLVGLVTSGDFKKRGVGLFLSALASSRAKTADRVRALIVGKETHTDTFQRQADELGIGALVRFMPVSNEVERFYHAFDVFVYPALYEEFGQSVQEAMACGVPVLTSARVGAGELLGRAGQEMLLDAPTEEGLAERLDALIESPSLRRRWAEAGRDAVRQNTWQRNFERTLELYITRMESAPSLLR